MNEINKMFLKYQHDVYNYLVYFTRKTDVEDIVQEVFIKLIRRKSDSELSKALLFTVARHTAIDFIRKERLLSWLPDTFLYNVSTKENNPEKIVESKEELLEIFDLLKALKRDYKEVIILRKIQGMSVSETAEILEWTESKVTLTLHRAVTKLRGVSKHDLKGDILDNAR
jgi:RNA polymerase sigma-70 factor (ECF subfamily)